MDKVSKLIENYLLIKSEEKDFLWEGFNKKKKR
jgi:hypothetical protein